MECGHCGGDLFEVDIHEGERVCCGCGMVDSNFAVFVPELEFFSNTSSLFKASSAYKRRYHFNERVAQLLCTGPKAPLFVVHAVLQESTRRRIRNPFRIDSEFVKSVCCAIKAPKFAER